MNIFIEHENTFSEIAIILSQLWFESGHPLELALSCHIVPICIILSFNLSRFASFFARYCIIFKQNSKLKNIIIF